MKNATMQKQCNIFQPNGKCIVTNAKTDIRKKEVDLNAFRIYGNGKYYIHTANHGQMDFAFTKWHQHYVLYGYGSSKPFYVDAAQAQTQYKMKWVHSEWDSIL